MLTTTLTIPGVPVEKIAELHALFDGDAICSEVIASATVCGANAEQMREWMGAHKRFPVARLISRQYNAKQKTDTVQIEVLCDCVLKHVMITEEALNRGTQTTRQIRFRPSSGALLLIYRTLGRLNEVERLEVI